VSKRRGILLGIEGTDGSGKSEQSKRLVSHLRREKVPVAVFDFPQYSRPSSYFVREYLNGRYGSWKEVGPRRASLFYALDRFDAGDRIRSLLRRGYVVVSNRYAASNMGHQGAKISGQGARKKFLRWVRNLEYELLRIPKPDASIVLHVPAKIAYALIGRKGKREYLRGRRRDIHEEDIRHLERAEKVYLEMARLFPKDFRLVRCVRGGKLRTIEDIHGEVWRAASRILGRRTR